MLYATILTLITQHLGFELPPEVLTLICQNAILRAPWCADILGSYALWCGPGSYVPPRPRALAMRQWRRGAMRPIGQVRLESMRKSVDIALDDFIGEHTPYGRRLQKYTAAHRKEPLNFSIKAFCLDMERQHTKNSFIDLVPRFDGWITCGKPVGKYRKFELVTIWPTLYGKDGWANKLKKQ
jgi:hypothetical protein